MEDPVTEVEKPSPHPRELGQSEPGQSAQPDDVRSRRGTVLTAVLAALVLVSAAGTWYLSTRPAPADVRPAVSAQGDYTPGTVPSEPGRAAVRAAAAQVGELLSYDYRTLQKDLRDASAAMTPAFTRTFRKTFNEVVKPMAAKNKAVTKTLVTGAGLVRLTDDNTRATCLVFIDQILVRSTGRAKPKIGRERVVLDLRQVEGAWLINDIKPF